ncbi:sarcoplasmic calcium-binding proteins ii, v, vi, and vii [Plakobranchus ocellatus]|uniref:Sarcoplasmic calcium-binding proteins ii, v, vi, and vii n=1 Tax=Plakobranchus ocellatus TaxID=259542 RepID=A0AAV4DY90_9GAST|nr:sarcoplasmic calcium-binding proteins ii, v, vi, and vii [Plakobranchus ocellatus]
MAPIHLSVFQHEKLEYYFKFYEPNAEGCLDDTSLSKFMKRVLAFTKWSPDDVKAVSCREVHEAFFEVLFERAGGKLHQVSLQDWEKMWSNLLPGCMGIGNFPVWLRLLPKTLFQMIDRNNDEKVGVNELAAFYTEMVNIPPDLAQTRAAYAFDQMTDYGHYPLDLTSYEMIFSNFLIGRTPFGPGRHIFGCFEHSVKSFKLIQTPEDEDEENASNQSQPQGRRSSTDRTPVANVPYSKPKPMRQGSSRALVS